jgi:hypothetical protein
MRGWAIAQIPLCKNKQNYTTSALPCARNADIAEFCDSTRIGTPVALGESRAGEVPNCKRKEETKTKRSLPVAVGLGAGYASVSRGHC